MSNTPVFEGEPVTAVIIAERLGVTPNAVWNWAARDDRFPKPAIELPRTTVWDWAAVQRWAWVAGKLKTR